MGNDDGTVNRPRVIQVIESIQPRGSGLSQDNPCRSVIEYHTLEGKYLAENDPCMLYVTPGEDRRRRAEESRRREILVHALKLKDGAIHLLKAWERLPESRKKRIPEYFQIPMRGLLSLVQIVLDEQDQVDSELAKAELVREGFGEPLKE